VIEKETKNKENSFAKIIWLIEVKYLTFAFLSNTEDVAQSVRALVCGSKGRGFDPLHPPKMEIKKILSTEVDRIFFISIFLSLIYDFMIAEFNMEM
jgi:hypothetical protein